MAAVPLLISLLFVTQVYQVYSCPDLTQSETCLQSKCTNGGHATTWTVPWVEHNPFKVESDYLGEFEWSGETVYVGYNKTAVKCCRRCTKHKKCKYWLFVKKHANGDENLCIIFPKTPPTCDKTQPINAAGRRRINPKSGAVCGDPHFISASGAQFEFNGLPGNNYCFISDKKVNVNMKMAGYLDNRLESATAFKNGKAIRSWIRELGIMWNKGGAEHTLKLVARSTGEVARGSGYLEKAEIDGVTIPRLQVGSAEMRDSGLTLKFEAQEKSGPYDVDFYTVDIPGVISLDVRVRVAHRLLRRPDDAQTHFDIKVNKLEATPAVHGVLGQTYRGDHKKRVAKLGDETVVADSVKGEGFLDGVATDYITSDVLTADSKFSVYQGANVLKLVTSE